MTEPGLNDSRIGTRNSKEVLDKWVLSQQADSNAWDFATLDEVRRNFIRFDLLDESIKFIVGDVRKTLLEDDLPGSISLLRLDTDFYDSTLIEMQVLWPRLVPGGILILDDYGHWDGARKAVDEYFVSCGIQAVLKIPIPGGGGRVIIKPL